MATLTIPGDSNLFWLLLLLMNLFDNIFNFTNRLFLFLEIFL